MEALGLAVLEPASEGKAKRLGKEVPICGSTKVGWRCRIRHQFNVTQFTGSF